MSWQMVVGANWLAWCQECIRSVTDVSGPQLFLLCTAELFSIPEKKLYGYAEDSNLVAVVPSPGERVAVPESMNRDQSRVSMWCDL